MPGPGPAGAASTVSLGSSGSILIETSVLCQMSAQLLTWQIARLVTEKPQGLNLAGSLHVASLTTASAFCAIEQAHFEQLFV